MLHVDGIWADESEIIEGVKTLRRLRSHGVTKLVECDDNGDFSGRLWGMLAEPSAHTENKELAILAGCAYEPVVNQLYDGRFYCPASGFTLLTLQIKHSSKGSFNCSRDAGTEGGKIPYNLADAEFFQFRESCTPCRSLFVPFRAFPVDENGNLLQKSCSVKHDAETFCVKQRTRAAVTPQQLVELLKTRLFFLRASLCFKKSLTVAQSE